MKEEEEKLRTAFPSIYGIVFLFFLNGRLKVQKPRPLELHFYVQLSVCNKAGICDINIYIHTHTHYVMRQFSLLLIGKERSSIAVPSGFQI